MATYYAWSPITIPDKTKKQIVIQGKDSGMYPPTRIPVGGKVTKDQVGDDWRDLVACGAIRTRPYPKNVKRDESPRSAELRAIRETVRKLSEPFDPYSNPDLHDDDEDDAVSKEQELYSRNS